MEHPPLIPLDPNDRRKVLVADDDPSTRQFLSGALVSLGFDVALAVDGPDALRQARATRFDALLLDCRMPHGGAIDVLRDLLDSIDGASAGVPAFATSAEISPILRGDLEAAGFVGAIEKPCKIASLSNALHAVLGPDPRIESFNDDSGVRASGDEVTLQALRDLLRLELLELHRELHNFAHDPEALVERLHRLRSACGFCGAERLGLHARALQAHVAESRRTAPAVLERFKRELEASLHDLEPARRSASRDD